jgi:ankyrin repeat protein
LQQRDVWTASQFEQRMNNITGLDELTRTPFMVRIIVDIMPRLHKMSSTPGEVKQSLILLLQDQGPQLSDIADLVWAELCKSHISNSDSLGRTQRRLKQANPLLRKELREVADVSVTQWRKQGGALGAEIAEQGVVDARVEPCRRTIEKALVEKPIRRFAIYRTFTDQWVELNLSKASLRSSGLSLTTTQLTEECWVFMERLACYLLENGLSKLHYIPGSVLFSEATAQDEFFGSHDSHGHADLRRFIRSVIPLSVEGNDYGFIHKSVLEFLAAKFVRDDLLRCVTLPSIDPETLVAVLKKQRSAAADATLEQSLAEVMKERKGAASGDAGPGGAELRRIANSVQAMAEELRKGGVGKLDLAAEEAVRDFVMDCLQAEPVFCTALEVVWGVCDAVVLHGPSIKGELKTVQENIAAVLTLPNSKRNQGNALHVAAQDGNLHVLNFVVRVLFDNGGEGWRVGGGGGREMETPPNTKDKEGRTPLHIASKNGHELVVKALLAMGVDRDAKLGEFISPDVVQFIVIALKDLESEGLTADNLFRLLKDGASGVVSLDCVSAMFTSTGGKNETGEVALREYLDPSKVGHITLEAWRRRFNRRWDARTPLHDASEKGHEAVVGELLAAGADCNAKTNLHDTPLHLTAKNGHEAVVGALLKAGADKDTKDQVRGAEPSTDVH